MSSTKRKPKAEDGVNIEGKKVLHPKHKVVRGILKPVMH